MAKKSMKKAAKKTVKPAAGKKSAVKKAAKKTVKKAAVKKAAAVAAVPEAVAMPRVVTKADGAMELDFGLLHEKLDGYRNALKEILAVRDSTRVRKMLEKIDGLQDDVNCQSTMIVGF